MSDRRSLDNFFVWHYTRGRLKLILSNLLNTIGFELKEWNIMDEKNLRRINHFYIKENNRDS